MGTFDVKFVEGFSSFFATTVMRNLAAYQYAFRNMQETVEKDILLQVQTPLVPEPLSSALNSDQVEVDEEFANPDGTFIEA